MDRQNINKWKAYLRSLSFSFNEEWLPACIEWIYENHSPVLFARTFKLKSRIDCWCWINFWFLFNRLQTI